jgi:hypothetical protein
LPEFHYSREKGSGHLADARHFAFSPSSKSGYSSLFNRRLPQ